MRVVSNTSPISYLIVIDHIDLLPPLFGQISIPETVANELSAVRAPSEVKLWIASPPTWLGLSRLFPVLIVSYCN